MEAVRSSEISVNFTTWRHISEDSIRQWQSSEVVRKARRCEIITENITRGKVYLVITNPVLDLVPPWLEASILQLPSLRVTVRRDGAATSLTHLYNGETESFRSGELEYSETDRKS
jgi:hypothetical protein